MKIAVFGPEQRVGALEGERVIDLNGAFASYLREQRGDTDWRAHADTRIPSRLEAFISVGQAAIDDAQRAIQHVAKV
ncbi:MAG TPA: FAA hydrolase family protein, partial [Candidatus Binatia bacterium]